MPEVNVGDEKQVKQYKKKYQLNREREREEIRELIRSSFGRRFLWRILTQCKIFSTTSHHNPHLMAVASGSRDVGLWLLKEINEADGEGYIKLVRENQKEEN